MDNGDPALFADPDAAVLDRKADRHFSFGLACIDTSASSWACGIYPQRSPRTSDRVPA
jgi:hypothetical protein